MSVFNETLRRMGGTVSPQLGGGGSSAAPYVPGPMGGITGAQTGIGAGSSAMSPMNAAMSPMMAAVLGTGVEALLPYGIDFIANAYDGLTGQGTQDGRRLAEREKLFAGLQGQLDAANQEAIRRARATAGQAIGGQLAVSGAAGLSSFNPILAAQARQGEAQMAGRISNLERQGIQSRADYETGRAQAIDQALNSLTGSAVRRRNARQAYEAAGLS
tara:strand:- start:14452 stop:15099 length:648 start_codon:yes stop_codon:yes gene_type:complete